VDRVGVAVPRRHATSAGSVAFVAAVIAVAYAGGSMALAIYALSFWHYYLYWLAYRFGAVPLAVFKRDAVLMKSVSLAALAVAYLAMPLDLISLAVIAAGFLLNTAAAAALGSDRTYYGYELADLPPKRVTAFPYSVIAHPMLFGNIAAFGGTLINAEFRYAWWPLAGAHIALNLELLVMETAVAPGRQAPPGMARRCTIAGGCGVAVAGAVLGAAAGFAAGGSAAALLGAAIGTVIFVYSHALYCCYSAPVPGRALQ
jgi:hypothetical protein